MANREANFVNNWSTVLDADMAPTDLSAIVPDTSSGPPSPCYLDIDYTDDDKREYIYFDGEFTGTAFVTSTIANRYLAGSAAASGITHTTGAVVRAITAAQALEDIHDRISANANDIDSLEGHTHDPDVTGGPLATVAYQPGALQQPDATDTAVALDATNLKLTFTVPASGSVLAELSSIVNGAMQGSNELQWSLWDAATGGSEAASQAVFVQAGDSGGTGLAVWVPGRAQMRVTGLTPDADVTWFWRHKRLSGTPASGTRYGGKAGAAVMRVWEL